MKIVIECEERDMTRAANLLKSVFDVKKVSKFYPNAIGSQVDLEGKVFVNLNGFKAKDYTDLLTSDMLYLLSESGIDLDSDSGKAELVKIQQFFETGKRGLEFEKLMSLYVTWRNSLLKKIERNDFNVDA